jgi:septum site-determining protein MinD
VGSITSGTVLVVTSGKGGVGKSTTALNLSVALGIESHSVALVDADLEMANLGAMLGVESEPRLHDVLAGDADVESAVVTEGEAFGIVPGGSDLAKYAEADPERLPEVLTTLAERYEYVVVDAGAGLGYADVVPIDAADEVILVTTPIDAAIGDTAKLAEFSGIVDARTRGVVVTRVSGDVDAEAIAAEIGVDLLGVVPEDPAVSESADASAPLEQYAPESPAAAAYRQLANVVVGSDGDSGAAEAAAGAPGTAEAAVGAPGTAEAADEGASTEVEARSADDGPPQPDAGDAPKADETPVVDGESDGDEGSTDGDEDATGEDEGSTDGDEDSTGEDEDSTDRDDTEADESAERTSTEREESSGFFSRIRGLF